MATVRRALSNPDMRRLQLGFAASAIGRWAAGVGLAVYVFAIDGAAAVAGQLIASLLPAAFAAPILSTLADRRSRVAIMVGTQAARVVMALAMAGLILTEASLGLIYVASALNGILGSAFEPAKQALLPDLAREPDELTAANVVSSSIDSTSFFLGPAVAGLVLAASSAEMVLFVTAALLAGSALLVARIREPARATDGDGEAEDGEESFVVAMRGGAVAVVRNRGLRLIVGLLAAQTLVAGLEATLIAALALDLLDLGDSGLGFLEAALGVGGLIGAAFAVGLVGQRRLATAFGIGCVLWGIPFTVMGVFPGAAVAAVGLAIVGLGNTLVDVSAFTLIQRITPAQVMGRVFGIVESVFLFAIAIGAGLGPILIALFDIEGALIAQGLILPVLVALGWAGLRRVDAAADAAVPEDTLELFGRVPMLAVLPAATLERLAAAVERVQLPTGAEVITQGEPGDRFYVIASGRVEVLVDGRPVREQGPGESFGEIALLRDVPRTATVRMIEPGEFVVLEREDFLAAVTGHGGARDAADRVISSRLLTARPAPARF